MIHLIIYDAKTWAEFSVALHENSFGEYRPKEKDRIDFAICGIHAAKPVGWVTCKEFDAETLYLQFGGAIRSPEISHVLVVRAYEEMIEWAKKRYKKIYTLIENNNIPMLKMAWKVGFRIEGIRFYKSRNIFLEHWIHT